MTPPPAVRASAPGWRDPRLWVGIVIVAASVLGGARLLTAVDDTVSVWAAAADMGAGDTVTAEDLVAEQVRFSDVGQLDRYFRADDELPGDLELVRGVAQGELLPRAAVGSAAETDSLELPLAVDPDQVPGSVGAGSIVDVYLVGGGGRGSGGSGTGAAVPALAAVTVVDAPSLEETFGTTGKQRLVLAVAEEDARAYFTLLSRLDNPVITVVRRG